MSLFGAADYGRGRGGGKRLPTPPPIPKICQTYPAITKLGRVLPYLNKIQKLHESRYTSLDFC